MVARLGAQIALLAFAATVLAGIAAGNSEVTVLSRALIAMLIALILGQLVGFAGRIVVREHLQRLKHQIDREHLDALDAIEAGEAAPGRSAA